MRKPERKIVRSDFAKFFFVHVRYFLNEFEGLEQI